MTNFVDPEVLTKTELLRNRIVLLFGEIDSDKIQKAIEQIMLLASIANKDITIYINSPGGTILDGLGLYDIMQLCPCDISTVCVGRAASMASILLAGGTKGKRFILPHGRVMIHQIYGEHSGTLDDLKNDMKEIGRLEKGCNLILSQATGKSIKRIENDQKRDFWMSAQEAVNYGIVDTITEKIETTHIKKKRKKRKR